MELVDRHLKISHQELQDTTVMKEQETKQLVQKSPPTQNVTKNE